MCPCGNHNYADKRSCNKCKTPRTLAGVGPKGGQAPAGFRPGDWLCSCGNHNYASKSHCRCGVSKAMLVGGGLGGMGMGMGMGFGDLGFGLPQLGGGGGAPSLDVFAAQAAAAAQQLYIQQMAAFAAAASGQAGPASGGAHTPSMRAGDWVCPNDQCRNHNYASRSVCNKCEGPKPL